MKLLKKSISSRNEDGIVVLIPDDGEDLWHLFNIITVGDQITCSTFRKVVKETSSAVSTQRVRVKVTVKVLSVDFNALDGVIRVAGVNVEENVHIKLGAHHTVQLVPGQKVALRKECWDSIAVERLDLACDPAKQATVAAVVMDKGLANVCLISGFMTIVKSRIEKSIPKKRAVVKAHDAAMIKFFESVLQSMVRELDLSVVKVILIASPGYVKDDFFKYMMSEAEKRPELKIFRQHKEQFILVHASSGHKHALEQILTDEKLKVRLLDARASRDAVALAKFFELLNEDSEKAFYGYDHVRKAQDAGAIESLLVSDSLFRSIDVSTRMKYTKLVEDCRDSGANVHIFSSLHTSGEQLNQLSGVAALLRYGLPELNHEEMHTGSNETHDIENIPDDMTHTGSYYVDEQGSNSLTQEMEEMRQAFEGIM